MFRVRLDYACTKYKISGFLLLRRAVHWHSANVGITLRQFNEMSARVNGSKSCRTARPAAIQPPRAAAHRIILGLDPSLRGTGYGVIETGSPHPDALTHGTISCPRDWTHSQCLAHIAKTLRGIAGKFQPTICAVEGLFFAQNLKTALVMGEARGAALATLAEAGLEIYEIAPRKVKQAIVGYGAAQKIAVAKMVQRLLRLSQLPAADAADALALALVQAQNLERSRFSLKPLKPV